MNTCCDPCAHNQSALPSPAVITTTGQLAALVDILAAQPAVAVDTESNSLYAYRERVCLIQFSIPGQDYLVDPLAGLDLSPLGKVFAAPGIEKIFHAADYDLVCLKRDFGFECVNLFDTMWAARILGWPKVGLGAVLAQVFGVHTNKHYQRYNWGKRPLDADALLYACLDTHYLIRLRHIQADELRRRGRWEEAQEVFAQIAAVQPSFEGFSVEGFWRIKGACELSPGEQAILRELYVWRDREARRQDRPPFKVLDDCTMVELARAAPRTADELLCLRGLKSYHVRRYGQRILWAIQRGLRAAPPSPPSMPRRPPEEVVARFRALQSWRKRQAEERGVEADVILSNAVLWALAEHPPRSFDELRQIDGLGPWKCQTYGAALIELLKDR
ncbi:MAG: HRDC domain-containing protein [Anaerolineae bacterium]|nr:HRDC domain-containing protein [Anaerolineae bacterium]